VQLVTAKKTTPILPWLRRDSERFVTTPCLVPIRTPPEFGRDTEEKWRGAPHEVYAATIQSYGGQYKNDTVESHQC